MTSQEIENITLESLRDWFKKEKWVRITTSGNIAGPCGTSKNKKNPDRCLPAAKARSLTKAQRAATARKKKRAGAKGKTVVKNTKAATVTRETANPQDGKAAPSTYNFTCIIPSESCLLNNPVYLIIIRSVPAGALYVISLSGSFIPGSVGKETV